jgi:L-alanine-DL-glutamate epimerase-like enolase superfamily enzyme
MKIENIETTQLEMAYTKPLVTATNNFTVARGLLVKVVSNGGTEGYGYADLFPRTGETPETAQHVIESVLKSQVIGKELEDLARIRGDVDQGGERRRTSRTGHSRATAYCNSSSHRSVSKEEHRITG